MGNPYEIPLTAGSVLSEEEVSTLKKAAMMKILKVEAIPLGRAHYAIAFSTALHAHGVPVESLLQRARLPVTLLEHPGGLIGAGALWAFAGDAACQTGIRDLGLLMLAVMWIVAVLVLPMMALGHDVLATGSTLYFVLSAGLSVLSYVLAHRFFPDTPSERAVQGRAGFLKGYSRVAAVAALKSTVAVLPIAVLFIVMGLASQILVMFFAAIFSLSPEVTKGHAAGTKSLKSTLIDGATP